MCVYLPALRCVNKCLLFAPCFSLTPFNSRDSIYPQSQRIMGGKLGNLQDFCAETQLMLAYQKHNETWMYRNNSDIPLIMFDSVSPSL